MEFIDNLLGVTRRKQEKLIAKFGISGEIRQELVGVGADQEEASVVEVKNDRFISILKGSKHEKILSHLVNQSDTHQYRELYLEIQKGVFIKTGVASIDYSQERTLLADLDDMTFKYNSEASKGNWSVYNQQL